MYVCATLVALALNDVLVLLADVIGLPVTYAIPLLALPALPSGALVWWVVVERRGSRSFRFGSVYGALTALLTSALWTARFVSVWGREMLAATGVRYLVGFVFAVVLVAGAITGLPMMYARRRLAPEPAG